MATLKELMGDKTRGDGRRFTKSWWDKDRWFEPIFYYEKEKCWVGLNTDGWLNEISDEYADWQEWTPPKKIKKVKVYRAIYKTHDGGYCASEYWGNKKEQNYCESRWVAGWEEKVVEVDE